MLVILTELIPELRKRESKREQTTERERKEREERAREREARERGTPMLLHSALARLPGAAGFPSSSSETYHA